MTGIRKTRLASLAAVLVLCSPKAHAQIDILAPDGPCQLDLTGDSSVEWRGLYGRGYEVTGFESDFETISVTIRHQGDACEYILVATSNAGGENVLLGAGDRLFWDILSQPSGGSIVSSDFFGNQDRQLLGRFAQGSGAQPLTLYFTIPAGQFVRGGQYNGQALLRLFRLNNSAPELVSELPIALIAPVPAILQVRSDDFTGGSQEIRIDLGDISQPSRHAIDFNLISNATIEVSFVSENNGMLKHQNGAPGVAYDLRLNGAALSLAGTARQRLDMLALDGSRDAQIEISVPPQSSALAAGRYTDSITVIFTADP
ncbi:hypothetical protein [Erythrobacter sp. R86502]|uniref:hypothetical protein n=1 Tax=Erythrobacter sp. R86502 TaxID=3093846 RepID=UPI0036D3E7DA